MSIPFIDLKTQYQVLKPEIDARIQRVLDHGQYIMGPEVKELEERLAAYVGSKHCVTVSSGTEALLISLMALGVGPGDEVITPPFTFAATGEVIALVGATPVFVDIDPVTYNVDPQAIAAAITPQTKAIMPVSLYGQPADMDAINAVAGDIPVIEDAAQSFGATYHGRKSCNLSTIGCTSFFPSKPLGCYGDGGALFTNDDALAQACREIRVHGQSARYVHTRIGVGGRMDTLQCAIVLAKLDRFDVELEMRQAVADRYFALLAEHDGAIEAGKIVLPRVANGANTSVYAQFTIQVPDREGLRKHLDANGVPSAVHYPIPLNEQPAYRDICKGGATPVSKRMSELVMSLPMGPDLSEDDQREVVRHLIAGL
ncbi:DegT/DnrJ/EryC1/StrS family aminotransferase [Sphingomonas koreensis]|uniref:DegT/DnrJ/EryC1/StrS family aminotransferase n=1 Tax=Sphingomonas koreensis TaxID=93064 RepID=A0A2M8WFT7_9SPHN|nr:DegT/DnrJ/EryC1/StrS family aminotransferase [Sphingomonas koreensis]PJI89790.1 UDP-2-acetamido-2-deoxy-ribo-hexuluronate aminotransferase [Sphingomonas koreensis]RSU61904.1 DegT/DnrJ/EryC1/StrS family aminotransferase [Sphingomonas koreensis]RSU70558.1 DegT/DnrJ/EryC1/StrS family aminotransferase [Sphingomonas koreensis]RSY81973.1 DegT/DnrJ/EryC1/StrS family aminotransferase [Sphingomonas koreensis]